MAGEPAKVRGTRVKGSIEGLRPLGLSHGQRSCQTGLRLGWKEMPPAMTDAAADDDTYLTAEARARVKIDVRLKASGFAVQKYKTMNLYAQEGVAVREFRMAPGHGTSDYLLFNAAHAVGVAELKKTGETLSKVESQTGKYSVGLPEKLEAPRRPLPFLYETTDNEIQFTNLLDPEPRSRRVFGFHRPETMARWLREADLSPGAPSLRARLQILPELSPTGLWDDTVPSPQSH